MKNFIIEGASKHSDGHRACLKQSVYAMIEIGDHKIFGSNKIMNDEITECPRDAQGYVSGAGYHLCKEICNQGSHAEIDAINNAHELGIEISGGKLTLVGHTYCCDNCTDAMTEVGIADIEILDD